MIPKWSRRVNAPTQNGWLIPQKSTSFYGKIFKVENYLRLTAVCSPPLPVGEEGRRHTPQRKSGVLFNRGKHLHTWQIHENYFPIYIVHKTTSLNSMLKSTAMMRWNSVLRTPNDQIRLLIFKSTHKKAWNDWEILRLKMSSQTIPLKVAKLGACFPSKCHN